MNFLWPIPHLSYPTFILLERADEDFDFVLQQHKPSLQFSPNTGIFIFRRPAVNMTFPIFSCFCQISPPVASSHLLPLLLLHVQSFPVQSNFSERLNLKSLLQRTICIICEVRSEYLGLFHCEFAVEVCLRYYSLMTIDLLSVFQLQRFNELCVKYFSSSDGQSTTKNILGRIISRKISVIVWKILH